MKDSRHRQVLSRREDPAFEFVDIQQLEPSIVVHLPYETKNNFTNEKVYPTGSKAFLRRPVAEGLLAAHRELQRRGYGIKVWDAYRPFSIQEKFWKVFPQANYVSEPVRKGKKLIKGSVHNRGAAVDITLVDANGVECEMPTPFDEFTERAHRNYLTPNPQAAFHRGLLEEAMHRNGFVGLPTEWWHFDWRAAETFPLSDEPIAEIAHRNN